MSSRKIWSPASPPEPEDKENEPGNQLVVLDNLPAPIHVDNVIDLRPEDEETAAFAELLEALSVNADHDTEIEHIDLDTYRKARKND